MRSRKGVRLGMILLAVAALSSPCFAGKVFNFDYNFPGDGVYYNPITASGTLTTDDYSASLGGYLVTGIQGKRTVDTALGQVESNITGLLPLGYPYSNVLFYPGPPFLGDFYSGGLAFTIDNFMISGQTIADDFYGDVLVYYDSGLYTEAASFSNWGTFNVSEASGSPSVPEPSTMVLLGLSLAALAGCGARRLRR